MRFLFIGIIFFGFSAFAESNESKHEMNTHHAKEKVDRVGSYYDWGEAVNGWGILL